MNRRNFLKLSCAAMVGGFSGCTFYNSESESMNVEQSEIQILDRMCDESDDSASITFRNAGESVDVSGSFGVRKISYDVGVQTYISRSSESVGDVEIQIDQFASSNTDQGESDCPGIIDYEASVSLSSAPNEVVVKHIKEEDDRAWLETVATSSP